MKKLTAYKAFNADMTCREFKYARHSIGGNRSPESAFGLANQRIKDLYDEAKQWLDGEAVSSQGQADGLAQLVAEFRKASKAADAAHKDDKAPHLEASRAMDDKYRPMRDKAKRASDACKAAVAPWLAKVKAEQDAEAERLRLEAEEKAREAQAALRSTPHDHLTAREEAEAKLDEAREAKEAANRAARKKSHATPAFGRALGLRTYYTPVVTDPVKAVEYFWNRRQPEIVEFLVNLAERELQAGQREIPGFEIQKEEKAQ